MSADPVPDECEVVVAGHGFCTERGDAFPQMLRHVFQGQVLVVL